MYDEIQIFIDLNVQYSSQYGVLETSLWWHASKPHIVVLSSIKYLDYSPIASILLIMVDDPTPKHKIGMHSYLNEIHCGSGPPIFTSQPLHIGCVILILIWTHIQCPRQSPLADSSTHSTLPKVLPMASAFSLVIHLIYSPQFCTKKDDVSNIVSSTVAASPGWNKPTMYLSKDLGPCINIRSGSSSSLKKSITILFPRSSISKLLPNLHIIFSVLVIASRLILHLVKNLATKTLLFSTTLVERFTIWVSFVLSDNFAHLPWRSSIECADKKLRELLDILIKNIIFMLILIYVYQLSLNVRYVNC